MIDHGGHERPLPPFVRKEIPLARAMERAGVDEWPTWVFWIIMLLPWGFGLGAMALLIAIAAGKV